jgi:predicted MPP superfamily phosphohydrolase
MPDIAWGNLAILLLLSVGNAELLIAAVNRIHARPIHSRVLRQIRHLHDVLLPALPLAMLWFVGWTGPALLRGGSWSDVPLGWRIYMAVCLAGCGGLSLSVLRHWRRETPSAVHKSRREHVDFRSRLKHPPAGDGRHAWLAWIPGNQLLHVEFARHAVSHPRVPAAWDGLRILHVSDWHFGGTPRLEFFERVVDEIQTRPADLIAFTGDLIDRDDLLHWIPRTLGRMQAPFGCWYVLGNHDWGRNVDEVRRALDRCGWNDVASRMETVSIHGQPLTIAGDERPWMGTAPAFDAPDGSFRLLLSHSPDVLAEPVSRQADLILAGHTHGGQIVIPVVGPVYAPSRFGVRYAGGWHAAEETLLHVSRGLSGEQPIRWNCPPEVSWIELRAPQD